ncbi:hypothetical protein EV641_103338 [Rhodococcus sp. SMB37]|uniref:hypothetical protein n=1 Tax=Rhodococcus sp. SMB37 TaxID=2512213 RepID=UPI001042C7DD|nr:hypothetical protein [Rhodococcus sp. SMB37]TCN55990.1 hypothetical protein EV641_103338 [Rhodococcus sp. SMB37]
MIRTRWWPFAATTVLVVLLAWTGVIPTWPGLVHLVALPPLDMFADLRVLLVATDSWPQFLFLLTVVGACRIALLAWLMGGIHRWRLALTFYAIAFAPIALAAFSATASYAVLYSRIFWPAVTLIAAMVLIFGPVPWQGADTLLSSMALAWRRGLRVEVMITYCAAIVLLGAVADMWSAIPLVPVSAMVTLVAVRMMERPPVRRPLVALAATVAVFAASWTVFVATRSYDTPEQGPRQAGSLLILSGINSKSGRGAIHATDVHRLGYTCDQVYYFSYAGPGDGQPQRDATCPIRTGAPYEPGDTQVAFARQVDLFVEQAEPLPRPLVVAAHSHAAWVVWDAVAAGRVEADALLLVGPFASTPLGYPPPGVRAPRAVLGDLLRWAAPITDLIHFNFDPDTPAARDLLATAGAAEAIFAQPMDAPALSLTSTTDPPLMPHGRRLNVERNGCPARVAHPHLPKSPQFEDAAIRFLNLRPPPPCPVWRDWGAVLAQPFGPPTPPHADVAHEPLTTRP